MDSTVTIGIWMQLDLLRCHLPPILNCSDVYHTSCLFVLLLALQDCQGALRRNGKENRNRCALCICVRSACVCFS
jgi:hypothetical protein